MNTFLIVAMLVMVLLGTLPIYMDYVAHGSWFWTRLDAPAKVDIPTKP